MLEGALVPEVVTRIAAHSRLFGSGVSDTCEDSLPRPRHPPGLWHLDRGSPTETYQGPGTHVTEKCTFFVLNLKSQGTVVVMSSHLTASWKLLGVSTQFSFPQKGARPDGSLK